MAEAKPLISAFTTAFSVPTVVAMLHGSTHHDRQPLKSGSNLGRRSANERAKALGKIRNEIRRRCCLLMPASIHIEEESANPPATRPAAPAAPRPRARQSAANQSVLATR